MAIKTKVKKVDAKSGLQKSLKHKKTKITKENIEKFAANSGSEDELKPIEVNDVKEEFDITKEGCSVVMPKSTFTPKDKDALVAEIQRRIKLINDRTVIVQPLNSLVNIQKLMKFSPNVVNIRFRGNKHISSRGRAFIVYADAKSAKLAAEKITGHEFGGKKLRAQICSVRQDKSADSDTKAHSWVPADQRDINDFHTKHLYVTGIHEAVKQSDMERLFPKATAVQLSTVSNTNHRGTCFVEYLNANDAMEDFCTKNDVKLNGYSIIVTFAIRGGKQKKKEKSEFQLDKAVIGGFLEESKPAQQTKETGGAKAIKRKSVEEAGEVAPAPSKKPGKKIKKEKSN